LEKTQKRKTRSIWPKGSRAAVTLSFDFDAETFWLSRNPENIDRPVLLSHGAYGHKIAVPRILELLKKHRILATFFIPGWVAERPSGLVEQIQREGHEVGHHGYLHEPPRRSRKPRSAPSSKRAFQFSKASLVKNPGDIAPRRGNTAPGPSLFFQSTGLSTRAP
jgi:peptidoglycan-N-acetylglucosamine deacetylase